MIYIYYLYTYVSTWDGVKPPWIPWLMNSIFEAHDEIRMFGRNLHGLDPHGYFPRKTTSSAMICWTQSIM